MKQIQLQNVKQKNCSEFFFPQNIRTWITTTEKYNTLIFPSLLKIQPLNTLNKRIKKIQNSDFIDNNRFLKIS